MTTNVPPAERACTLPWCESEHRTPDSPHVQLAADIDLDGPTIEIYYAQRIREDGTMTPFVQIRYGQDWHVMSQLDVPADAAVALSEILLLLPVETLPQFIAATMRAATGPHTAREIQW